MITSTTTRLENAYRDVRDARARLAEAKEDRRIAHNGRGQPGVVAAERELAHALSFLKSAKRGYYRGAE